MLDTMDMPSECSDCARYQKEISELKETLIKTDYQMVRLCMRFEDDISELNEENSYMYELIEDAKYTIRHLKAERNSAIKSKKGGVRGLMTV